MCVCFVNAVREGPASHCHSEQMVMRRDMRVVSGYVEFRVVIVEEISTRDPIRLQSRWRRIRLVGDLAVVVRVVLMDHFDWRVWEMALAGVTEHQ